MHYVHFRRNTSEPCYGETGNGIVFSFPNNQLNSQHRYDIWLEDNHIRIKDYTPIQNDGTWGSTPYYYNGSTYWYNTSSPETVFNVLLASGGGGGSGSSIGTNGDSGGSGAAALFRINLRGTSQYNPIIIQLSGGGSASRSSQHSTITYNYSEDMSEGYLVGGGRCNSETDPNGYCGKVMTWASRVNEQDFKHIYCIKKLPGKS